MSRSANLTLSCCSVWLSNRHLELYLTHCSAAAAAAADTVKKRVKTRVAKCAPLDNDGRYPYEETIKTQDFFRVLPWTAQDGEH